MSTYKTRVGVLRRAEPVTDYAALLDGSEHAIEHHDDDGREALCGTEPWPTDVPCPDCELGPIAWAEAGFVPGHRICPWCGSHWSLETRDAAAGEPRNEHGRIWFVRRARFYR